MRPITPAQYTGTGSRVTLASILGVDQCKWFRVEGAAIGSTPGRVGGSNVALSPGAGFPIYANSARPQQVPPIARAMEFYDLTKWYIVLSLNDTAVVGCAV